MICHSMLEVRSRSTYLRARVEIYSRLFCYNQRSVRTMSYVFDRAEIIFGPTSRYAVTVFKGELPEVVSDINALVDLYEYAAIIQARNCAWGHSECLNNILEKGSRHYPEFKHPSTGDILMHETIAIHGHGFSISWVKDGKLGELSTL